MNITDNGVRNAACGRREMGDVGGAKLNQLEEGLRGRAAARPIRWKACSLGEGRRRANRG
jgi:hypothetical protein